MVTRRSVLRAAVPVSMLGMAALRTEGAAFLASPKATDVRIEDLSHEYEDFLYRTPLKFGGNIVDRVTLLNVHCTVRTRNGKVAKGFGSMPLGNVWSFPSKVLSYDDTLGAMKTLAGRIQKLTADYNGTGHPIDINGDLDPEYHKAAAEVTTQLKLVEPIPAMCTLVTASPFDAAIHDAFGKVHGLNCYQTYGPEFMSHDLSHYLGPKYQGEYISQYVSAEPKPRMPMYHLVGAVDPIEASDIKQRIDDGLPETLPEWINYNGLTHLKIKLNGEDLDWDVDRVVRVDRVAAETQKKRGVETWVYSLDFNEKAPNVGYLLDFMRRVKEQTPQGYDRIQYVEQPTARDLRAHRENVMTEAAKLRPVVIDESLINYEDLLLAREMGYSGVALKACKGQSHAVVLAAAAQKFKMFLCVQDLTCPGASLIQSAGLSAHIPTVHAIEANARQYVPVANQGWEKKFPGLFIVKDGTMKTAGLDKPGLGAV
jgi:L-alanine-DL-glutamate epimerase-like enolase superfamily enzyme